MTDTPLSPAEFDRQLKTRRSEIDEIDSQLVALIKERCTHVAAIGEMKRAQEPGRCPIRPGREAEQVRRVARAFQGTQFMPAAAAAMWRNVIMSSLALEGEIRVSVYHAEGARDYYWLAREYFGSFTTIIRQPSCKRVLGDLIDGKAQVGVLPTFAPGLGANRWWSDVPSSQLGKPKVFAALPFVYSSRPTPDMPSAVALGMIEPEKTGEDLTYVLMEAQEMVSQDRMQSTFAQSGIESRWLEVLSIAPGRRQHLVELKGFITPDSVPFKAFTDQLGRSLMTVSFLGSLAAPLVLA